MYSAHQITREFEAALCEYSGAKHAVAVNSCTMALLLALGWHKKKYPLIDNVLLPSKTYVSVPMSAIHAGFGVVFSDYKWEGSYKIFPFDVVDSARRFTHGMYVPGQFQCVSFHTSKILGDTQGGAILHDCDEADAWFRRARFDGRTEGVAPAKDYFYMIGWHCYLSPDVAARLLWAMSVLPKYNRDLPNDDYPDLSKFEVFNGKQQ